MADFFEHGVYLQHHSASVREANHRYSTSCNICCARGFRMDCDRCPIENANKESVAVLRSVKSATHRIGQRHKEVAVWLT